MQLKKPKKHGFFAQMVSALQPRDTLALPGPV